MTTKFDPNKRGQFEAVKPMWRVEIEIAAVFIILIALCVFLCLILGCSMPVEREDIWIEYPYYGGLDRPMHFRIARIISIHGTEIIVDVQEERQRVVWLNKDVRFLQKGEEKNTPRIEGCIR